MNKMHRMRFKEKNKIRYRKTFQQLFLYLLVFLVFIRGFLSNYTGTGTIYIDLVLILEGLLILQQKKLKTNKVIYRDMELYFFCLFIAIVLLCFQYLIRRAEIYSGVLEIRNTLIYIIVFIYVILSFNCENQNKLYNFITTLGTLDCLFAIVQYIGRSWLPTKLLIGEDISVFALYGVDAVRVTGLIGNPIVFGGFTIIFISMFWAKLVMDGFKQPLVWIQLAISSTACILTFGRACTAGLIIVLVFEYLFSVPKHKLIKILRRMFVILIVGIIVLALGLTIFVDTIPIQRLLGQFGSHYYWNEGTDLEHFTQIQNAIEIILQYPIVGYGIGKAGYSANLGSSNIITDGSLWTFILEYGVPMFILFAVVCGRALKRSIFVLKKTQSKYRFIALGYLGMNLYLISFSIVNSAYFARPVLMINWIFCGMVYNIYIHEVRIKHRMVISCYSRWAILAQKILSCTRVNTDLRKSFRCNPE